MPNIPDNEGARAADLDLIRRVTQGDESALAALYDRYAGLVYSVAVRVLKDNGAAEEILQDTFYQLWRNASAYDGSRGGLGPWLLVSARNRAIDHLRRRKTADPPPEGPVALAFRLESNAERAELMSAIRSALDGLPLAQRQALEMAYFEGMTHVEISQRTGEPLGTVKTRLRAALQGLRRALHP